MKLYQNQRTDKTMKVFNCTKKLNLQRIQRKDSKHHTLKTEKQRGECAVNPHY